MEGDKSVGQGARSQVADVNITTLVVLISLTDTATRLVRRVATVTSNFRQLECSVFTLTVLVHSITRTK